MAVLKPNQGQTYTSIPIPITVPRATITSYSEQKLENRRDKVCSEGSIRRCMPLHKLCDLRRYRFVKSNCGSGGIPRTPK